MSAESLKKQFQTAMDSLKSNAWFKKDKWIYTIAEYPRPKPEGVTLQIFKPTWLNEDGQGIHIESYLPLDAAKRKKTYVTLHVLHHPKIPGTQVKRIKITKPFIDAVESEVKSWGEYEFRAGKYGAQTFAKYLDGTAANFSKSLESELARICKKLAPKLDEVLNDVLTS